MADAYIYDADLKRIGIVDAYKSLIWARRYREAGDCELYVPATDENLAMLRIGYFIGRDNEDALCRITKITLTTDANAGNYIIAAAQDAQSLLDQRIVWETMTCYSNAEAFARRMVDNALGSGAAPERQMRDSQGNLIFGLGASAGLSDRLSEQVSYKNVGEKIREYCKKFGWGYRVRFDGSTLLFELYRGEDRSGAVIFSDDYENLSASQYVDDETHMGNVAVVAGEGEGSERFRTVTGDAQGFERHELGIDARDLSKSITYADLIDIYGDIGEIDTEGGAYVYRVTSLDIEVMDADQLAWMEANYPEGEIVVVEGVTYYRIADLVVADLPGAAPADTDTVVLRDIIYQTYLISRGLEQMAGYGAVKSFEGKIEPNTTFVYRNDYDLGDIVTVQNGYGISISARITEVVEVFDDRGSSVEPKFEKITAEEG